MGWGKLNQPLMPVIIMPCIEVVMSKSREWIECCSPMELWDYTSMYGVVYTREYKEGVLVHNFKMPWFGAIEP